MFVRRAERSSVKMYKSRIALWGFGKKVKGKEVKAIVRKKRQRLAAGKASIFRIRGQILEFDKVQAHLKRKGLTPDDIPSAADSPVTGLECYTPSGSSPKPPCLTRTTSVTSGVKQQVSCNQSLMSIAAPDVFKISEELFKDIHTYFTGSFASATWGVPNRSTGLVNAAYRNSPQVESLPDQAWAYIMIWAGNVFTAANAARTDHYLQQVFVQCEDAIKAEEPLLLINLLEMLDDLEAYYEKPEIARILLRHIHSVASIFLGKKHPIATISKQLSYLAKWANVAGVTWNVIMDIYEQFLGPNHVLTSELRLEGLIRFFGRNRLSLAETQLREFLCKPQRASDYDPFVHFLTQYHLAWVLQQRGKLQEHGAEAERLAQESASWCCGEGKSGFGRRPTVLGARSLLLLSELQELRGNIVLAEQILRDRCERCMVDFGSEDLVTQAAMADYSISTMRHDMLRAVMP
jgi:hypothetical protein